MSRREKKKGREKNGKKDVDRAGQKKEERRPGNADRQLGRKGVLSKRKEGLLHAFT